MVKFVIPTYFTAKELGFTSTVDKMQSSLDKFSAKAAKISLGTAAAGTAIIAPLTMMGTAAIEFEDKMADVGKTTGLQGAALDQFGDSVLNLSKTTRTSIDDILKIGEIGGQLGVPTDQLLAFTDASNKFAVALAADYSGGTEQAIQQVGKIKALFADTRNLDISDVINRTGSAINELGAVGAGTSENINDFVLRMGQLPDAVKPSLTATAALGTFFEEVGLNSEIASGGLSRVLLTAGERIDAFAKQMKLPVSAAKQLLATDPSQFAVRLAKSLEHLKPDELATALKNMGLGSQEAVKVIGALGSGQERLATLMGISGKAFEDATSLQDEYNKKNNTTAGKLAQARNNFQALSITIGTQLIPLVNRLLEKLMPIIQSFAQWVSENKETVKTVVELAAKIGGALLAISMLSGAVSILLKGFKLIKLIMPVIKWLIQSAFKAWPVLLLISIIDSLQRNWEMVVKAFKEGSIIDAILAIGKVLLDAVLYPLQKILEVASYLPGVGDWAAQGAQGLAEFRAGIGLSDGEESAAEKPFPARVMPAINTKTEQNDQVVSQIMSLFSKQKVEVELTGNTDNVKKVNSPTGNPVKTTSTLGFGK